jgi:hypothetical protein
MIDLKQSNWGSLVNADPLEDTNVHNAQQQVLLKDEAEPDYPKLKQYLKTIMPVNKHGQPYKVCPEAIKLNITGDHHNTPLKGSDIENWGLGVGLYYAFLKTCIKWFSIMFVISLINCGIYYRVWEVSKVHAITDNSSEALKEVLTLFSLGGMSSYKNKFFEFELATSNVSFALSCTQGTFTADSSYSYFGLVPTAAHAKYIYRQLDKTCNNDTTFDAALAGCYGKTSCSVTWNTNWFDATCLAALTGQKAYLKMYCIDARIDFPIFPYPMTEPIRQWVLNFIIVIVNAIILLVFFWFMHAQAKLEKNATDYYLSSKGYASNYTIQITGFLADCNAEDLLVDLYGHLRKYLEPEGLENSIYDIQLAQSYKKFYIQKNMYELQSQATAMLKFFYSRKFYQEDDGKMTSDLGAMEADCNTKIQDSGKQKKALNIVESLKKIQSKQNELRERLETLETEKDYIIAAYVTFERVSDRNLIMEKMGTSPCGHLGLRCCADRKTADIRVMNGRILAASSPPEPENIIWENIQYSPTNRFFRRVLSYFIWLCMFTIPVLIIIF